AAALARVPALRVVGRASAFAFKGQNNNIKTVGERLGATYLLEGFVGKAGDRLHIIVQLIKASDGAHLLEGDYDRPLTDVFAIQEDIARTITASLNVQLGSKPGENLVNNRSIDPESYEQYLRANLQVRARTDLSRLAEATALLEQVITRNPAYAP